MATRLPDPVGRRRVVRRRRVVASAAVAALAAAAVTVVTFDAGATGTPRAGAAATAPAPQGSPKVPAAVLAAERSATARAKATGKPVTVDAETDTATLVAANPDGTLTMSVDSAPVRARKNGAWVPVDPTLAARADGMLAPKASACDVAFSGGGSGPLVVLSQGTETLSFTWPAALPTPTVSGADATYPQVLPGVDLVLTADAGGFSELLVVADAKAAANPALKKLTLGVHANGVTLSGTADGGAVATDAHGATVFHSDTATMWDSAGVAAAPATAPATGAPRSKLAPTPTDATHKSRVAVAVSAATETLTPDPAMLASATTDWPLFIDPAWGGGSKPQLHWARISSNGWNIYDSTSTGSDDHPRAGYDGWSNGETARTYYQLNVGGSTGTTGIRGATVTSATLYVKDYWAASHYNTPVNAYQTAAPSAWSSSGLNWSNKPGWGTKQDSKDSYEICGATTCTGVSPGTLSFSVLAAMKAAAKGSASSVTVGLGAPDEGNQDQWKQFASGGGATISVTYYRAPTLSGGTGSPTTTPSTVSSGVRYVTSGSPTLKITGVDADGENVRNGYEIWHWVNGAATTSVVTGMFSAYSLNGGAVTYPRTLADGTYAWRGSVESQQGLEWSPWSAWQTFTVDTSAPTPPAVESPQFPADAYGGAYGDTGVFTLTTNGSNNVKGYIFAFDGDLGTTVYGGSGIVTWTAGTVPVHGTPYWVPASVVPNGYGQVAFAPGTVGPHRVYAKAVDGANNTSAETTYKFYAGLTTPTYAYGDKMVTGYTAADGTVVPAGTAVFHNGGRLVTQPNCCDIQFADPSGQGQGLVANTSSTATVVVGDTATLSFDVPKAGYWDLGANLTESKDYGQYSLTLDKGTAAAATLLPMFDAYNSPNVTTAYRDFGTPKNSAGAAMPLAAGLHTLTLTVTGANAAASGHQAGIDVLRLAPMSATCAINDLTACLNNTAVSQDTNTAAADADGGGHSFSATELGTAGWSATGTTITVNGAPMKLPGYRVGAADNITASGQLVQVPGTGVANDANAVVFLGFATNGSIKGATGEITYAGSCGGSNTQAYVLDTVPDWVAGSPAAHVIQLAHRNLPNNTQDTHAPQVFALSVPLACPGLPVSSITLPVVSDGITGAVPALHIMGVGLRAASFTDSSNTQNWTGAFADGQDSLSGPYADVTFRMPVTVSVGGTQARVRLSNALGKQPVTFTDVSLARATAANGATATSAPTRLTFQGGTSITLPAGGEAVSDAVSLAVDQQSTMLVSATVSGSVADVPAHGQSQSTAYFTGDGADHALDVAATAFTGSRGFLPYLTGIDVTAPGNTTGSLVLYGDQTVNSDTGPSDGVHHLSDLLTTEEADANGGTVPFGVLGVGRNGLTDSNNLLPAASYLVDPLGAVNPADRAILDQSNVRTVLVSEGTSDVLAGSSADTIEKQLISFVQQARDFTGDTTGNNPSGFVTAYVATIPPNARFTAAQETVRETVDNFILCGVSSPTAGICSGNTGSTALGSNADGAIDFAAAVSSDGTDTGGTVAADKLSTGSDGKLWPNGDYYLALAQQFVAETSGPTSTVGIQPMVVRTH